MIWRRETDLSLVSQATALSEPPTPPPPPASPPMLVENSWFLACTGERDFVASHQIQKQYLRFHKVYRDDWNSKPLSSRLIFAIKLFTCCLLKSRKIHLLCRFVSLTVGHYNLISFLVLCLVLLPAVGDYNFLSFLVLCLAVSPVARHWYFTCLLMLSVASFLVSFFFCFSKNQLAIQLPIEKPGVAGKGEVELCAVHIGCPVALRTEGQWRHKQNFSHRWSSYRMTCM